MDTAAGIQNFLSYVVEQLTGASAPETITCRNDGSRHLFELSVPREAVPKLIGHGGNTIAALRSLASAAGEQSGLRVGVEIRE